MDGHGDEDLAAKRADAAAKLAELMGKLKEAQARLDAMVSESAKLREKLREVRLEDEGGSPNGA
jgi:uncharacterized coiled-coil DUF342 family protein